MALPYRMVLPHCLCTALSLSVSPTSASVSARSESCVSTASHRVALQGIAFPAYFQLRSSDSTVENVPRALPAGLGCVIDAAAWPRPPLFAFLAREGNVAPLEMARTFNNGIGMVLIVAQDKVAAVTEKLAAAGEQVFRIGEVTATPGVQMLNLDQWHA